MVVSDEKLREKLLRKLEGYMKSPKVEFFDHGTGKKAYIKKAFQVLGQLFSIELVFFRKLEVDGGEFYVRRGQYLIKYNSRSTEGGYNFYTLEDIANALNLSKEDMEKIFNKLDALCRLSEKDLTKAKGHILKKIERSATKLAVA
jgi:hypothetical protein